MIKKLTTLLCAGSMIFTLAACSTASKNTNPKTISPLDGAYTIDDLGNCTVYAQFTTDDFDFDQNCIYTTVYDKINYDAADVSDLEAGDKVDTGSDTIEIETIEDTATGKIINNGKDNELILDEADEDGGVYTLAPTSSTDTSNMKLLGQVQMTMAEGIVLDEAVDTFGDIVEIPAEQLKDYVENLEDNHDFNPNVTTLTIENGVVTKIYRGKLEE